MGLYINPPDMTKEQFFDRHIVPYRAGDPDAHVMANPEAPDDPFIRVYHIDNIAFTALGICFDQQQYDQLSRHDGRRKKTGWMLNSVVQPYLYGMEIGPPK